MKKLFIVAIIVLLLSSTISAQAQEESDLFEINSMLEQMEGEIYIFIYNNNAYSFDKSFKFISKHEVITVDCVDYLSQEDFFEIFDAVAIKTTMESQY